MLKNYKQNKITSNGTRIISFSLLILFLFSFLLPFSKALAATPTITATLKTEEQSSVNNLWRWGFDINTTNVADDTNLLVTISKKVGETYQVILLDTSSTKITNNNANYVMNNILESCTYYRITFSVRTTSTTLISTIYSKQTQGTGCTPVDAVVNENVTPTVTPATTTETTTPATTELNYYPLAPLPGVGEENCEKVDGKTTCVKLAPQVCEKDSSGKETCRPCTADDPASECKPGLGFAGYLNAMIKIFIGICAVLAMIMIVMGGIQYMTSELVSGKAAGKEQITHAILGLLLALGAYAILNTINPNLLDVSLGKLETATITIQPDQIAGDSGNPSTFTSTDLSGSGVICTKTGGKSALISTANSFVGKVTYSLQWPFGYNEADKTIYSNCSTWVNQVYDCVGLASPGSNANTMFQNTAVSEKINIGEMDLTTATVNKTKLQPGDLLGWISGENPTLGTDNQMGHVVMYTGGVSTIEVHGPKNVFNKAIDTWTLSNPYGNYNGTNLFKHIIRVAKIGKGTAPSSSTTTTADTFTGVYYSGAVFWFDGAFVSTQPLPDREYYVQNASDDKYILIDYKFNSVWSTGAKSKTLTAKDIEKLKKAKTVKVKVKSAGIIIGTITTTIPD